MALAVRNRGRRRGCGTALGRRASRRPRRRGNPTDEPARRGDAVGQPVGHRLTPAPPRRPERRDRQIRGAEESDKPPVLDKGARGRALTTADFFATPDDWADGRFNVAGQKDLAGIGGPLVGLRRTRQVRTSPTIEHQAGQQLQPDLDEGRPERRVAVVGVRGERQSPGQRASIIDTVQRALQQDRQPAGSSGQGQRAEDPGLDGSARRLQTASDVEAVLMDLKVE